jgi:hypothetical protein
MEAFLHRLSYLESTGKISSDARIRACREVRAVLTRARAMGLTRSGAPAAGLGEDFALHRDDVPAEPEPGEPGRDLPAEIMRQICAHQPRITSAGMSTGIELGITPDAAPRRSATCPTTAWPATTADPRWSTTTTRPTGSTGGCRSAKPPPRSSPTNSSGYGPATPTCPSAN